MLIWFASEWEGWFLHPNGKIRTSPHVSALLWRLSLFSLEHCSSQTGRWVNLLPFPNSLKVGKMYWINSWYFLLLELFPAPRGLSCFFPSLLWHRWQSLPCPRAPLPPVRRSRRGWCRDLLLGAHRSSALTAWTVLLLVCRLKEEDTSKSGISSKPQRTFD